MISDLIESHSPVFFFRWFALCFQVKTYAKNSAAQKAAQSFLHTFLLENEVQTSEKKYRAVVFFEIGDHMQKFSLFGRQKKT